MSNITDRQTQLLKMIVEEYANTSTPVGSKSLVQSQQLEVSSATIRNEMANMITNGYLEQPHTSAGRIPTTLGFRYYIDNLLEEVPLPVLQEVAIKQKLWQERHEVSRLFRQVVLGLSELTKHLTVLVSKDGETAHAGSSYILDHPEFHDIDVTKKVLSLLDDSASLEKIFSMPAEEKEVHVLVGQETQMENFDPCAVVFSPFDTGKKKGFLAVVGPNRINYPEVIPAVKYFTSILGNVSSA